MSRAILTALCLTSAYTGLAWASIKITTTTVPDAISGVEYSASLAASGGPQPFTWSLSAGALPGGLSVKSAGSISGTPTAAGTANFTVKVKDANGQTDVQDLRLTVNPAVV